MNTLRGLLKQVIRHEGHIGRVWVRLDAPHSACTEGAFSADRTISQQRQMQPYREETVSE